LIKVVAALEHETMPPTLWADQPSDKVSWSGGVSLLTAPRPWPRGGRPRLAGVSAFGVSGTNAHVIVEQAPADTAVAADSAPAAGSGLIGPAAGLWLLSGHGAAALSAQAAALADRWRRLSSEPTSDPAPDAADVGWSLAAGRDLLANRAAVVAPDPAGLLAGVDALARGERWAPPKAGWRLIGGTARARPPRLVFVFPGQGGQWPGMGRQLLARCPAFADTVARCDRTVADITGHSILKVLSDPAAEVEWDRVDVIQPVLFAVMVGLAQLWAAVGVKPDAVIGHSQGEIAAAVAAGALSVEDGAAIVAWRSRLVARLSGQGAMASLRLSAEEAQAWLASRDGRVFLAAVNGPASVVVSGQPDAVDEILAEAERRGLPGQRIEADYASHSPQVEALRDDLLAALAPIRGAAGGTPFYSTTDGRWLDPTALDASYWYRNLRQPVGFGPAIAQLAGQGFDVYAEVSPHPVLLPALEAGLDEAGLAGVVTGTLWRQQDESLSFLTGLSRLAVAGRPVDWAAVYGDRSAVDLPPYNFQHRRHWLAPAGRRRPAAELPGGLDTTGHPWLSTGLRPADGRGLILTGGLSTADAPWLAGHAVTDTVIMPGAALLDMAWTAARLAGWSQVDELVLEQPLVLDEAPLAWQLVVDDQGGFAIYARPEADAATLPAWTRQASGRLAAPGTAPSWTLGPVWPPPGATALDLDGFYDGLAEQGYAYGPAFQGLSQAWQVGADICAEIETPSVETGFAIAPNLLDAAVHPALLLAGFGAADGEGLRLPFAFARAQLYGEPPSRLRVRLGRDGEGVWLRLADAAGRPVAEIGQLLSRPADPAGWRRRRPPLLGLAWGPTEEASAPRAPRGQAGFVVVGSGGGELAAALGAVGPAETLPPSGGAGGQTPADLAERAHLWAKQVLSWVQTWMADDRLAQRELVILTRG
ncbi:MAG: acyltransferase domain-containing protein, partial [Propionibacteriaceae bacterium]|nr:acyltransferase domain-containing protein [Propionibacteriaceae bacterium]